MKTERKNGTENHRHLGQAIGDYRKHLRIPARNIDHTQFDLWFNTDAHVRIQKEQQRHSF